MSLLDLVGAMQAGSQMAGQDRLLRRQAVGDVGEGIIELARALSRASEKKSQAGLDVESMLQGQRHRASQDALQRAHAQEIVDKQMQVNEPGRRLAMLLQASMAAGGDPAKTQALLRASETGEYSKTVPAPEQSMTPPGSAALWAKAMGAPQMASTLAEAPPFRAENQPTREVRLLPDLGGGERKSRLSPATEANIVAKIASLRSEGTPDADAAAMRLEELLAGGGQPVSKVPVEQQRSGLDIETNPKIKDAFVKALERSGVQMRGMSRLPEGFSLASLPPLTKELVMTIAGDVINEGDTPENIAAELASKLVTSGPTFLKEMESFLSPVSDEQLSVEAALGRPKPKPTAIPEMRKPPDVMREAVKKHGISRREQAFRAANVQAIAKAMSSPRFALELARAMQEAR